MLRPETIAYLDEVQRHARRTFRFRDEIGELAELGATPSAHPSWEELLFTAKFVTNASSVLRRVGPSGEDTAKLSAEFSSAIERGMASITALLGRGSKERALFYEETFLSATTPCLENLLALLAELAWLKNYSLDTGARRS
jgi:hypothetical protein